MYVTPIPNICRCICMKMKQLEVDNWLFNINFISVMGILKINNRQSKCIALLAYTVIHFYVAEVYINRHIVICEYYCSPIFSLQTQKNLGPHQDIRAGLYIFSSTIACNRNIMQV